MGQILSKIEASGLAIEKLRLQNIGKEKAREFYAEHKGKPFFDGLVDFIGGGEVLGMELVGSDAIAVWRRLIGPTNSNVARSEKPDSIRALFGTDGTKNAVHGSDSPASAERELNFFFGIAPTATFQDKKSTLLLIKPHILREQKLGAVLSYVIPKLMNESFKILQLENFKLNRAQSEEFLEVYKDVIPEFHQIAEELAEGPCVALALQKEAFAVGTLRKIVGPHDSQVGKALKDGSVRGVFGKDKVRNAVHCTDLEEDGELECEFFFLLLKNKN